MAYQELEKKGLKKRSPLKTTFKAVGPDSFKVLSTLREDSPWHPTRNLGRRRNTRLDSIYAETKTDYSFLPHSVKCICVSEKRMETAEMEVILDNDSNSIVLVPLYKPPAIKILVGEESVGVYTPAFPKNIKAVKQLKREYEETFANTSLLLTQSRNGIGKILNCDSLIDSHTAREKFDSFLELKNYRRDIEKYLVMLQSTVDDPYLINPLKKTSVPAATAAATVDNLRECNSAPPMVDLLGDWRTSEIKVEVEQPGCVLAAATPFLKLQLAHRPQDVITDLTSINKITNVERERKKKKQQKKKKKKEGEKRGRSRKNKSEEDEDYLPPYRIRRGCHTIGDGESTEGEGLRPGVSEEFGVRSLLLEEGGDDGFFRRPVTPAPRRANLPETITSGQYSLEQRMQGAKACYLPLRPIPLPTVENPILKSMLSSPPKVVTRTMSVCTVSHKPYL